MKNKASYFFLKITCFILSVVLIWNLTNHGRQILSVFDIEADTRPVISQQSLKQNEVQVKSESVPETFVGPDYDQAVEWVMRERRQVIREACGSIPKLQSTEMPVFYLIKKLNLLSMPIAKVGSTNWKKIIMVIEGETEIKDISKIGHEAIEYGPVKNDEFQKLYAKNHSITNLPKFTIVREPFGRLLSAYRNKIERVQNNGFGRMSKSMSIKYRSNRKDKTARPATFEEFLKFYTNPKEKQNAHWETFRKLVQPCKYQYDYILKLEDIELESNWLFRHLNLNITFPKGHPKHDTHSLILSYVKDLDKSLLKRVYGKLKDDYRLFNYPVPTFLCET